MQDPIVRHSFVQVNGSFIHLVQYGQGETLLRSPASIMSHNHSSSSSATTRTRSSISINDSKVNFSPQKLIILIPGNPGILGIYHDFLRALYRTASDPTNKSSPPIILAIGHNNFDHPDHVEYRADERICIEETDLNFVERALAKNYREEPHHVELQVLNKLIILKRLLNVDLDDCRLVFIGHSVGCYFILRLLQDRVVASAHEGSILIHPALENIGSTARGSVFNRLFTYKLDFFLRSLALVVDNLLPKPVKLAITRKCCSQEFVRNSSEIVQESIMQLVCQKTLCALIELAKSEFATIKNLNTESLIKPHVTKLKLIYAINDLWVHTGNRLKLKELYPDLYIEEQANLHAFVMDSHTVMDYAIKAGMFVQDFFDAIHQV